MSRLFFLLLGVFACAAREPITVAPVIAPLPPAPVALDAKPEPPNACIVHGTGMGKDDIGIALSPGASPLILLHGEHEDGVTWTLRGEIARVTLDAPDVRANGYADVRTRSFYSRVAPESVDGLVHPNENYPVRVIAGEGELAVVHATSEHVRPSIVAGRVSCDKLGMQLSDEKTTRPTGELVRAKEPWIELHAGSVTRTIEARVAQLTRLSSGSEGSLVHAHFEDVDAIGWTREPLERTGGAHSSRGGRSISLGNICGGSGGLRVRRDTELHVGRSPGVVFGTLRGGTVVSLGHTSGEFRAVSLRCSWISVARAGDELWVRADDVQ